MNDARKIYSGHPLFRELRNGLLWHCTSPEEYLQIRACGFIKPNNSLGGKYGRLRSACQALDGVSLFDFTTEPETLVLGTADKWQQFLGCAKPHTIILGLKRDNMLGKVVPYPKNRDITNSLNCSGPIPWVEVCHCGQIQISSIAFYLLVYAFDYNQFKKFEILNEADINHAVTEYTVVVRSQPKDQLHVQKCNQSPELKVKMEQARRQAEKIKRQAQ